MALSDLPAHQACIVALCYPEWLLGTELGLHASSMKGLSAVGFREGKGEPRSQVLLPQEHQALGRQNKICALGFLVWPDFSTAKCWPF